ncbi:transporter [Methanosarcina sp. 2.H.T.1A.6]|uniref:NRAMP family divalent metal transporter n=1 Tax=unclassified Methanosarcina TaxID=2644672 RepID=UPI0006211F3E|nr:MULTISPECIES: divalent metal cation transporter [unclassified Methanosarcina]KKG13794.1 transporter [Methanosarcina sp. 2.H.T.1A.3]KKG18327.1 transporter [Methanosarcina sp. 2.H.T.1A.15]KKG23138.1 transporter [Methanosarcina sp. 2.H.T.1A.6]KKG26361.1 transporter [Methanosarcina sp. 2.H.T.1A.8]
MNEITFMNEAKPTTEAAMLADAEYPGSRSNLFKAIGPGILVACAAIGGSHLVWSTQAGAQYGWSLLGLILLANLLKFPFFLYGQRYTAATGESLLAGYKRQGVAYVYIFLAINILTGIINIAGVAMLSGALFAGYGFDGSRIPAFTVGILGICAAVILLGQYKLLDKLSKAVVALLSLSTLVALGLAFAHGPVAPPDFVGPSAWTWQTFPFLVMLLGWMPMPVDLSAWSSLWMFSREEETGHFATTRETSIDFYLGYVMAVVMAVAFVALGKLIMYGSGQELVSGGTGFSQQLVNLYSANIGEWSKPLILTAAFSTMFSTTLTCIDGYPRSLAASCTLLSDSFSRRFKQIFKLCIVLSVVAACVIVLCFVQNLLQLLSFAAIVSFVTSPILAYINYRVINGSNVPIEERPGPYLRLLSLAGLLFFLLMTAGFVYVTFIRV